MERRFLSAMFSVVMVTSLMTGCTGLSPSTVDTKIEEIKAGGAKDNGGTGTGNRDMQATSGEQVALAIMDGYMPEGPHGQYIYQYTEELVRENPDTKVEVQAIASGDIYTKLAVMVTSPDDLPTTFFTSANQVPIPYDLGSTGGLNNWMSEGTIDDLADGVMDTCAIDRQMTYYPVTVQPQIVIYRMGRSEEVGLKVLAIWDEFVSCTKAPTKDANRDGQVSQWGLSMISSNNSSGQSCFMSYLWSNGHEPAYWGDGSGGWRTDIATGPTFVDVFSKWTDMNNVEGVVLAGITEADYPVAANYFVIGYTSTPLTGPNALGIAYANNPELKGKLGSSRLSGEYSDTVLGAEGYTITTKLTNAEKAAAAKYLAFFTPHDKNTEFWGFSGETPSTTEGQKVSYITGDDYVGFLRRIEDDRHPTLTFARTSGLKSASGGAYAAAFNSGRTNDQAAEQLVEDLDQLLENHN